MATRFNRSRTFFITLNRLPPSAEGEWWELADESRGGLPYYYQTKTGETVWERPEGFVIPLGIIQVFPISFCFAAFLTSL